jgi:hypothetical protein
MTGYAAICRGRWLRQGGSSCCDAESGVSDRASGATNESGVTSDRMGKRLGPPKATSLTKWPPARRGAQSTSGRARAECSVTCSSVRATELTQAYVQLKAGHSQGSITERYIHAAQVLFPGAAARGEELMFGAGTNAGTS